MSSDYLLNDAHQFHLSSADTLKNITYDSFLAKSTKITELFS